MIAEVYPLKRLPRRMGVFDYHIPEGLDLHRGDLVSIPMRNQTVYGIVARVKESTASPYKLKSVLSYDTRLQFSDAELSVFEDTAKDLAQSVSSLLYAALPQLPKREPRKLSNEPRAVQLSLPKQEIDLFKETVSSMRNLDEAFIRCPDLRRMAAIIAADYQRNPGVTSVICPTVRDAALLSAFLQHLPVFTATGAESPLMRFRAWTAFRESKRGILIGTRLSALLTHQSIKTIFLVRSSHEQHKQADKNPRYDTRLLSATIAKRFKARRFLLDVSPRVEDLALQQVGYPYLPEMQIVDIPKESRTAPHPLVGGTTLERIDTALMAGKKILCVFNKKGERNEYGNKEMASILQALLPGRSVDLVEKGFSFELSTNADILLVTNHFLEAVYHPAHPPSIGLVVDLDADFPLFEESFRAKERALYAAESWRGIAYATQSPFLLQTRSAELFDAYQQNPLQVLRSELQERIDFGQPPATRVVEIRLAIENHPIDTERLLLDLKQSLEALPEVSATEPLRIGRQYRLEAMIPSKSYSDALTLFSELPDQYIIDTSAFS